MTEFWAGFGHIWLGLFLAQPYKIGMVAGIVSMALCVALPLIIPHALAERRVRHDQEAEATDQ